MRERERPCVGKHRSALCPYCAADLWAIRSTISCHLSAVKKGKQTNKTLGSHSPSVSVRSRLVVCVDAASQRGGVAEGFSAT